MIQSSKSVFHAVPRYQPLLREVGLDAEAVFADPRIKVWRQLPERDNATLDTVLTDERKVRLHIKRYQSAGRGMSPAAMEARGIKALEDAGLPTVPLVGWGHMADGRSFIMTEDLSGHQALDRLVRGGLRFDLVRDATAALAARLHGAGLHHRDLYLCHFFSTAPDPAGTLKLIDAARVRHLPGWPTRSRWVVKDLAQFWYSTMEHNISADNRAAWLAHYAEIRSSLGAPVRSVGLLKRQIERKARWIARHDAKLNAAQPERNISIPH